ncbi:hypothetical protein [Paractinoplanes ferrugineus]|nr:hypothetical protein [Actinoplanes ferrugineus]
MSVRLFPGVTSGVRNAGRPPDYETPGLAFNRLRRNKPQAAHIHRYIQLPPELWTSGWMAVLSPAAIAMLIVLRVQVGAKDPDTEEHILCVRRHTPVLVHDECGPNMATRPGRAHGRIPRPKRG